MMKTIRYTLLAVAALLVASCSEEDYKLYDKNQKDSVFFNYLNSREVNDSSIYYNFGFEMAHEHEVDIPVSLMGIPSDHDRTIDVQPVADSTTMVEGVHYEIVRKVLRANAISDTVKVKLLRDNDPKLQTDTLKLRLAISPDGELRPTGQSTFTITYSDVHANTTPKWWPSYKNQANMPEYTFENGQLFFKYFYEYGPKANKEIFDQIIDAFGDYFVKWKGPYNGPITVYSAFFAKYILTPMYRDTKDQITWPYGGPQIQ